MMNLDPEESPLNLIDKAQFLNFSSFLYFLIILFAMAFGWFVDIDPRDYIHWDINAILIGIVATVPLLLYLYITEKWQIKSFESIRDFFDGNPRPHACQTSLDRVIRNEPDCWICRRTAISGSTTKLDDLVRACHGDHIQ